MNIYYVVARYLASREMARFIVTALSKEDATAQVMDEHCGRKLWEHVDTRYIGRKSDLDPEFFLEVS